MAAPHIGVSHSGGCHLRMSGEGIVASDVPNPCQPPPAPNSPQSRHLPDAGYFSGIGKIEIESCFKAQPSGWVFSTGADVMLSQSDPSIHAQEQSVSY
jgi:hypothetical protein